MKSLHVDPFCGAAGDMLVGALLDAGAPFDDIVQALRSLSVDGLEVSAARVKKCGIMATQFTVHVSHAAQHPHRNLYHVLEIIGRGELPGPVVAAAGETFRRIAACEAQIHGTTVESIHFHEIGAIDSIADIVAAHLALHLLEIEHITCSPLNVGSGMVKIAHGILPVPAPATALLLRDVPVFATDLEAELVTPTGAALLAQRVHAFRPMPPMRVNAVGYGSGTRDFADRPNVLRVFLGEPVSMMPATEPITVIEADIDDMNPELFPPLLAQLLDKGARDAFLTPLLGKKGRPAHLLTILCDAEQAAEMIPLVFTGSTTFGVRVRREDRVCLDREWKVVPTAWGDIRVKIGRYGGRTMSMSPEFEDCRAAAEQHDVPVRNVYEAAQAAAVKGEFKHV